MRARRIFQILIVGGSISLVTIVATGGPGHAQSSDEPCPAEEDVTFTPAPSPSPASTAIPSPTPQPQETEQPSEETADGPQETERPVDAALVFEDPEGVVIRFGKARGPITREFFLALPDRSKAVLPPIGEKLRVRQRPLEREEAPNGIDDDDYVANAEVTGDREVTLVVCIDPEVHPGTYKGIVTLEHPDMRPVVVPIEASLQFSSWMLLAIVVGVVVLVAAPIYVWASRKRGAADGHNVILSRAAFGEFQSWILSNFIAFSVATIAGTSAFLANYWYDPSWGAEAPKDWFTLIGAVFTAFTTGLLTGTAQPKASAQQGTTVTPSGTPPAQPAS